MSSLRPPPSASFSPGFAFLTFRAVSAKVSSKFHVLTHVGDVDTGKLRRTGLDDIGHQVTGIASLLSHVWTWRDRERQVGGGRGGIRTHGTLAGTPVFKTGALNHSATLPNH